MKKNVVILGSSGSIGESALNVALMFKDKIRVVGLSVNTRIDKLASQIRACAPRYVAVADENKARVFRPSAGKGVKVLAGRQGVCALAALKEADIVLIAVVGAEAIYPLWSAIRAGKTVALANKESVVVGGTLVADEARVRGARIIPIDSEQSAIFQCLEGYNASMVKRVYLTASGGPLIDYSVAVSRMCPGRPSWRIRAGRWGLRSRWIRRLS
jgi:1-deoxy-D-xylulose-5-phosphate reductoisomerase